MFQGVRLLVEVSRVTSRPGFIIFMFIKKNIRVL